MQGKIRALAFPPFDQCDPGSIIEKPTCHDQWCVQSGWIEEPEENRFSGHIEQKTSAQGLARGAFVKGLLIDKSAQAVSPWISMNKQVKDFSNFPKYPKNFSAEALIDRFGLAAVSVRFASDWRKFGSKIEKAAGRYEIEPIHFWSRIKSFSSKNFPVHHFESHR